MEMICVQTVKGNFEGLTKNQILLATTARKLQGMMESPTTANFEGMVCGKSIDNCPIDVIDLHYARMIFGVDLASIRADCKNAASVGSD